jgi:hypothetical protein
MKNIFSAILLFSLLIIFVESCQKNSSSTNKTGLTLSKSNLKRGEPLIVSTNEARSGSFIKWVVNPSSVNTWISSRGNQSAILFSNAGQYVITANYFTDSAGGVPYDSSSSPVIVSDSIYNDSTGEWAQCNSLVQVPVNANDQIILTPVSYSDTGLVFFAQTKNTYVNEYPHLDYISGPDSTAGYEFVFGTITVNPCVNVFPGNAPATSILSLSGISNGTFDLRFILNGTVYKGELTVTNTSCTFAWNYTSGVIISPLTITKQ